MNGTVMTTMVAMTCTAGLAACTGGAAELEEVEAKGGALYYASEECPGPESVGYTLEFRFANKQFEPVHVLLEWITFDIENGQQSYTPRKTRVDLGPAGTAAGLSEKVVLLGVHDFVTVHVVGGSDTFDHYYDVVDIDVVCGNYESTTIEEWRGDGAEFESGEAASEIDIGHPGNAGELWVYLDIDVVDQEKIDVDLLHHDSSGRLLAWYSIFRGLEPNGPSLEELLQVADSPVTLDGTWTLLVEDFGTDLGMPEPTFAGWRLLAEIEN